MYIKGNFRHIMSKAQLPDFDWDKLDNRGFGTGYSASEKAQFEQMIDGTLSAVAEKEVVKGVVVGMNDREYWFKVRRYRTAFRISRFGGYENWR